MEHFQLFQGHPSFLQCGLGLLFKQVTADFTHWAFCYLVNDVVFSVYRCRYIRRVYWSSRRCFNKQPFTQLEFCKTSIRYSLTYQCKVLLRKRKESRLRNWVSLLSWKIKRICSGEWVGYAWESSPILKVATFHIISHFKLLIFKMETVMQACMYEYMWALQTLFGRLLLDFFWSRKKVCKKMIFAVVREFGHIWKFSYRGVLWK